MDGQSPPPPAITQRHNAGVQHHSQYSAHSAEQMNQPHSFEQQPQQHHQGQPYGQPMYYGPPGSLMQPTYTNDKPHDTMDCWKSCPVPFRFFPKCFEMNIGAFLVASSCGILSFALIACLFFWTLGIQYSVTANQHEVEDIHLALTPFSKCPMKCGKSNDAQFGAMTVHTSIVSKTITVGSSEVVNISQPKKPKFTNNGIAMRALSDIWVAHGSEILVHGSDPSVHFGLINKVLHNHDEVKHMRKDHDFAMKTLQEQHETMQAMEIHNTQSDTEIQTLKTELELLKNALIELTTRYTELEQSVKMEDAKRIKWTGPWSRDTVYKVNDAVTIMSDFNDQDTSSTWIVTSANTNMRPSHGFYWSRLGDACNCVQTE